MPVIVTCYKCGRKLRIHDHLVGRKARCPVCKSIFMTAGDSSDPPAGAEPEIHVADYGSAPPVRRPPPAAPPEEEVLEGILHETNDVPPERDFPSPVRRRWRKPVQRASWEKVRNGVTLRLLSMIVRVLMVVVLLGGLLLVWISVGALPWKEGETPNPDAIVASAAGLAIILVLMALTAEVLHLTANVFCLAAPEKQGAKTLAIVTTLLSVLVFVFDLLSCLIPFIRLVVITIGLVEHVMFLFFLRAIGRCIHSSDLEESARTTFKLVLTTVGCWLMIFVVLFLGLGYVNLVGKSSLTVAIAGIAPGVCACFDAIVGIIALIWYFVTLINARNEIAYYLERRH